MILMVSLACSIWNNVNDAYSAVQVALALAKAFNCEVDELPLSTVLSWFEQKTVAIPLSLLYLGIKGIRLGPIG